MAIDFENLCLAPVYSTFGQSITFENPKDGSDVTMSVIDGTAEIQIGDITQIYSTRPAFRARVSDLTALGLEPRDMLGVAVSYHGRSYTVRTTAPNPLDGMPGEVLFILSEA